MKTRSRNSALRLVSALLAGALGAASLQPYLELRRVRQHLAELLDAAGLDERHDEAVAQLDAEPDPERCKLAAGRLLLAEALDRVTRGDPTSPDWPGTVDTNVHLLQQAKGLAEEALQRRPAAWQGFMILGATTYLEWSLLRDRRLATEAGAWETALQRASALAPAEAEPRRFLSMAYLEVWPMLSPNKKALATRLIAESFHDRVAFRRLLGPWLDVIEDLDEAFLLLPDEPFAWAALQDLLERRQDWPRFREARMRWHQSLRADFETRLEAAARKLRLGGTAPARKELLGLLTQIPTEKDWAPQLAQALLLLPPGLVDEGSAARFRVWLEWAVERCQFHDCALPPTTVDRLAGLAGGMPTALQAQAALAADDLVLAERLERREETLNGDAWASYLVQKVPHLLRRGELDAAREALSRLDDWQRGSPAYQIAWRLIAEQGGSSEELAAANEALQGTARRSWAKTAWTPRSGDVFQLALMVDEASEGLVIDLQTVPRQGASVELHFDGALAAILALDGKADALQLDLPIASGLHSLALVSVAGGPVVPRSVHLLS